MICVLEADAYLAACDVPGIQKLLPEAWNRYPQFEAIHQLEAVPVATVQLRYDGWVTELGEAHEAQRRDVRHPRALTIFSTPLTQISAAFCRPCLGQPGGLPQGGRGSPL